MPKIISKAEYERLIRLEQEYLQLIQTKHCNVDCFYRQQADQTKAAKQIIEVLTRERDAQRATNQALLNQNKCLINDAAKLKEPYWSKKYSELFEKYKALELKYSELEFRKIDPSRAQTWTEEGCIVLRNDILGERDGTPRTQI